MGISWAQVQEGWGQVNIFSFINRTFSAGLSHLKMSFTDSRDYFHH